MKIDLITIHTSEMENSIKFYQKILKMEIVNELNPSDNMRLVFLKGKGEVSLELIENKALTRLDMAEVTISIGIIVNDIATVIDFLKKEKISIKRGPMTVANGNKLLFIADPNGVEIEFIEGTM